MADALDPKAKVTSVVAFQLINHASRRFTFHLEPEGMNYSIVPGQTAELRIVPPQDPPQVCLNDDGSVSVYHEGWASIFIDGVETVDYLPTNEAVAYFESEEHKERIRRLQGRDRHGRDVKERFYAEQPEEYRAAMDEIVRRFRVTGLSTPEDKRWLRGLDPKLREALKASGALPFIELDDSGP
jgi:hypothetical protein